MKALYTRWLNLQLSEPLLLLTLPFALLLNWFVTTLPTVGHVVALTALLGLALLVWLHPVRRTRPYLWVALLALLAHLAVALWGTPAAIDYYGQKGSSDILQYMRQGQEIVSLLQTQPAEAFELLRQTLGLGTKLFQWIFAVLLLVTGGSLSSLTIIFTWLGVLGGFYFAKAYWAHLEHEQWGWFVLLLFFFPSAIFWLTFPLKDAYIFWGLGWLTYGISIFPTARLRQSLPLIIGAELVSFIIRPYYALFFGGAIIAAEAWRFIQARRQRTPINLGGSISLILFNGLLLLILVANGFFLTEGLDSPQGLIAYQQVANDSVNVPSSSVDSAPEASLPIWITFPLERIWYVFTVLFRPLPWEATNLLTLFAALENVGLLILLGLSLWHLRRIIKDALNDPFLLFALALAVLFVAAFSLQVSNFGTMMRVKVTVFPFIFPFVAIALAGFRSRIQGPKPTRNTP